MNLQARLDEVENEQLDIYEKGSNNIQDSIEYWNLVKEENLILYAARQRGINKLGLKNVPHLQVSEKKAKEAIEMTLVLTSLANSPYGKESWTLRDTNREVYETEPAYCFKKHGSHVHVIWDNDNENVSEFVAWGDVYCQREDGTWGKMRGRLSHEGLFYEEDNFRLFYVDFRDEARDIGATSWQVKYKNAFVSHPIFTSTRSAEEGGKQKGTSAAEEGTSSSGRHRRGGRRGGKAIVHQPARSKPSPAQRSGSPEGQRPGSVEEASPHRLRGVRSGGRRPRGGRRTPGGALRALEPGEVGEAHQTPSRQHRSRLGQLLAEAADPPVIVLAGPPNNLKCLRYRINNKFKGLFLSLSTNFRWAGGNGQGSSRMLVAFENKEQRKAFQQQARLPQSITSFNGNLDRL